MSVMCVSSFTRDIYCWGVGQFYGVMSSPHLPGLRPAGLSLTPSSARLSLWLLRIGDLSINEDLPLSRSDTLGLKNSYGFWGTEIYTLHLHSLYHIILYFIFIIILFYIIFIIILFYFMYIILYYIDFIFIILFPFLAGAYIKSNLNYRADIFINMCAPRYQSNDLGVVVLPIEVHGHTDA